jgi:hypothetical protein
MVNLTAEYLVKANPGRIPRELKKILRRGDEIHLEVMVDADLGENLKITSFL